MVGQPILRDFEYFKKKYKIEIPKEMIAQIGADVPVCLSEKFQRLEVLEKLQKNL